MTLSKKQLGVVKGMIAAMLTSIITITLSAVLDPFSYEIAIDIQDKIKILGISIIFPTLFLIASIGRLAKYRFFSPDDIDGSALSYSSDEALVLQSLLQNTLEQFVIAVAVYTAWCFLVPVPLLSAIPLCSVLFAIGRILFFRGYKHGAASRAFGFALTFYPTVLLFIILIAYQVWDIVS